jgi:hypothetical protein
MLQIQNLNVCRKFPGGAGVSHHIPNEGITDGYLNVTTQSITSKQEIHSHKCSEGLDFGRSIRILHAVLLSKIIPMYGTRYTEGMLRLFDTA